MRKVKSGLIQLKDIKHMENSRLRNKTEVGSLMEDIKQNGLLQSVGIRKSDNALIFGNRRVSACEKLDYKEINADFFEDVSDSELLILNVAENIKRESIGSVEIGRVVKMLMDKGLTKTEVASKLVMRPSRVNASLKSYEVAAETPFAKIITYGHIGASKSGIAESLVWRVAEAVKRGNRKLSKQEWNVLLSAMENGKITAATVPVFRTVLMNHKDIPISKALDILEQAKVVYSHLVVNRKVLSACMDKEKIDNDVQLIKSIIRKYNKELFF